jgi:ATP-dependent DNA helicase RecQ
MQFKCGYISDSIDRIIKEHKASLDWHYPSHQNQLNQIKGLLQYVSSFDVTFPYKHIPDYKNIHPVLAIINNIISRGLPTRAPIFLEELFREIGLAKKIKSDFEIDYEINIEDLTFEEIFELLHIIEPGLEINKSNYGGNLGSNLEWEFLNKNPFLKQVLESQRDFSTINSKLKGGRSVDFCFVSPYLDWNEIENREEKIGRIFEVDGSHHFLSEYRFYDSYRDSLANDEGFETLRFNVDEIRDDNTDFESLIGQKIYRYFSNNYHKDPTKYLKIYTLLFVPLAVSRIQKVLVECLILNNELLKKTKIEIAIIERDLPCGGIAIKLLEEMISNINSLLHEEDQLIIPRIELKLFTNPKWVIDPKLHCEFITYSEHDFNSYEFDIVLDHSILRRSKIYRESSLICDKSIQIRSSHYFDTSFNNSRKFYCSRLLKYKSLVSKSDDGSYIPITDNEKGINYFIQNIFRKTSFREGQLPIISRALQQKPVIGLLPTGGGKSLTYQLPAFLQPGLTLVVDPIKSLMEDQVRVLNENLIDCCDFINSNLSRELKAKKLLDLRYGETLLLFISPERFVMGDFRHIITNIDCSKYGLTFAYCVIDEVHCVSEWGHDFRSTYLMLGKNAQTYSKTRNGNPVALIGLTATASFDVLADIERELQIKNDDLADAIIMIENTIRPELFFRVIDVTDRNRISVLNSEFENTPQSLALLNKEEILQASQLHHFNEFDKKDFASLETRNINDDNEILFDYNSKYLLEYNPEDFTSNDLSMILFCPVKGERTNIAGEFINKQGVRFVHQNLTSTSKGYFYSSDEENISQEIGGYFIDFVNGKTKHIVCTKAFGMGIDKKNIRSTFHYYYSSSLESLVQEAGRSGRDKKIAQSNILVSLNKVFRFDFRSLQYETIELNENVNNVNFNIIKDVFHRRSIRKVIEQDFNSRDEALAEINTCIDNLKKWINGRQEFLSEIEKENLKNRFECFLEESYGDRDIHNFFHNGSFKGKDVEYSQTYSLFNDREFEISDSLAEINELYNKSRDTQYIFKYWSTNTQKRLYISDIEENDFGFIDLRLPLQNPNTQILEDILNFLRSENKGNDNIHSKISEKIITELNEDTLRNIFTQSEIGTFDFIITSEKIFPDNNEIIYLKISQLPGQVDVQRSFKNYLAERRDTNVSFNELITNGENYSTIGFRWFYVRSDNPVIDELREAYDANDFSKFIKLIYLNQIEKSRKFSKSFPDFLLRLEENIDKLKFNFDLSDNIVRWLKLYYHRSRYFKPTNDTGRLIYRMHSMGLLEDYKIDYNKNNIYLCTFRKYESIENYIEVIDKYLKRYLSEYTAIRTIQRLRENLTGESLILDIIKCLYFLSDFSYKEIASKRNRATDEIENILNSSISRREFIEDGYLQNLFIKEQIYFYFNAKYARIDFRINGEPFSLLDDYRSKVLSQEQILQKYLNVYQLDGAEQNNYKHMMGSCKKILRSLSDSDLRNEWLLRLLKAFAMYSVNNKSYISEANAELELGFDNLYKDQSYHNNEFKIIEPIFTSYFENLQANIDERNESFNDIKLIRAKLLLKMQIIGIETLINKNLELTTLYHA